MPALLTLFQTRSTPLHSFVPVAEAEEPNGNPAPQPLNLSSVLALASGSLLWKCFGKRQQPKSRNTYLHTACAKNARQMLTLFFVCLLGCSLLFRLSVFVCLSVCPFVCACLLCFSCLLLLLLWLCYHYSLSLWLSLYYLSFVLLHVLLLQLVCCLK